MMVKSQTCNNHNSAGRKEVFHMYKISNGITSTYLSWLIKDGAGNMVAAEFFDRSKAAVVCLGAGFMQEGGQKIKGVTLQGEEKNCHSAAFVDSKEWNVYYTNFLFDYDHCNVALVLSKGIGSRYILTTEEMLLDDFYHAMMKNYNLPLLKEWTGYLLSALQKEGLVTQMITIHQSAGFSATICMKGREIPIDSLQLLQVEVTEEQLKTVISLGLRTKQICISAIPQNRLDFGKTGSSLDAYMSNYGSYLQKNIEDAIRPLIPLKDTVDSFITKKMRPYPQQAAIINGMIALKNKGKKYGFLNCGMGCGKTIMGIGVVEGYANQKWLETHPGKTLKDMYLSDPQDQPKYRTVIMPPGHLVEKWKREILREVPGAQVEVLSTLRQLTEIRMRGKAPQGREWYIISKDFCKLGFFESPIPVNMLSGPLVADYCVDCYEDVGERYMKEMRGSMKGRCPQCGGRHFKGTVFPAYGQITGLTCPSCNRILLDVTAIQHEPEDEDVPPKYALTPDDFSSKKDKNAFCCHCGIPLWGANCKPIGGPEKPAKWEKISHYANWAKKNRKTAWVLKGKEHFYYKAAELIDEETGELYTEMDIRHTPQEFSPRKVSPARYIKKYLKGYWDFAILDECHKYAGAGTGQANAAHALIKTSGFTLGLTGTLTNGKADSLYYLLWMLQPGTMVKKGFKFSSPLPFSKQYGCVETRYEAAYSGETSYRQMTKGRQINAPRTIPGISPLVYSEFLLDCSENMDLADMTKYMPPLTEQVEVLSLPSDVQQAYDLSTRILKEESKNPQGKCMLGEMLNFCLSYSDKPYGREVIMHPRFKDCAVLNPPSCDKYCSPDILLPKEQRLVEIVNQEQEQKRNVFIFANFTGKEESNVTPRIKQIIEKHCLMAGRVDILKADSPEAIKREAYIHKRAKFGVKCVITNAKVCETGLDFCWEEEGIFYNYPTIIFLQPTYELATMMQASRRHYRLNQVVECRTYWMAYENTLQAAALSIMASKQVAAAAIQGKFSAEGLASMAKGVDARILLAKKLSEGDNSSAEELCSMFDVLSAANAEDGESEQSNYVPPKLYFELMGADYEDEVAASCKLPDMEFFGIDMVPAPENNLHIVDISQGPEKKKSSMEGQLNLFGQVGILTMEDPTVVPLVVPFRRRKSLAIASGQISLFGNI